MEDVAFEVVRVLRSSVVSPAGIDADGSRNVLLCAGSGAASIDVEPSAEHKIPQEKRFYALAPRPTHPLAWELDTERSSPNRLSSRSPTRSQSRSPIKSPGKSAVRSQPKANAAACVAVSPTGHVAVGESGYLPRIVLYDATGQALTASTEHQFGVCFLKFSPSGAFLASLGTPNDGYIYIWHVDIARRRMTQYASNRCISDVKSIAWLGDSMLVTVGVRHVRVWTLPESGGEHAGSTVLGGRNVVLREYGSETFQSVLEFPGGMFVAGTTSGHIVRLLPDIEVLAKVHSPVASLKRTAKGQVFVATSEGVLEYTASWDFAGYASRNPCCALVATGGYLIGVGSDSELMILRDRAGASGDSASDGSLPPPKSVRLRAGSDRAIWWTDGELGAAGWINGPRIPNISDFEITAADCTQELILGTATGELITDFGTIRAHTGPVTEVIRLGNLIVSGGRDRTLQLWDASQHIQTIPASGVVVRCVAIDDETIVCATAAKSLMFMRLALGSLNPIKNVVLKAVPLDAAIVDGRVVVSTNDKQVTTYDSDGRVVDNFRPLDSQGEPLNLLQLATLSGFGASMLAASAADKSLAVFTLPQGTLAGTAWGQSEIPSGLAWLPASQTLISAGDVIIERQVSLVSTPPALPASSLPRCRSPNRSPVRSLRPILGRRLMDTDAPKTPPGSPPRSQLLFESRDPGSPTPSRPLQSLRLADSQRNKLTEPLTPCGPVQQLENALKQFNSGPQVDAKEAETLRPLLVEAINKVDGLALVHTFGAQLLDIIRSQIPK